ncbi:MAG: hypothetical protein ACRCXB_26460 [Aeromonadaceae bacterium]
MLSRPLFWLLSLLLSLSLLLWRLADFVDEDLHRNYHMTRGGLAIQGNTAEWLQAALIGACAAASLFCLWQWWRRTRR